MTEKRALSGLGRVGPRFRRTLRPSAAWVDEVLLAGADDEPCLRMGAAIDREHLRAMVITRQARLEDAGLRSGGSVALNLPPSIAYVTNLLAAWRIGAQVSLLDHRLTEHEITIALDRLAPQVLVRAGTVRAGGPLRGFADLDAEVVTRSGEAARTPHAVLQLSSGSTGPSKVIGRTYTSLVEEVERYTRIDGVPQPGERIVLLASMVHVLGLVGALLYGLHAGCEVVVPERLTVNAILSAVAASDVPATLLGVPFHIELLAATPKPPTLPSLKRMTTGGELVRPAVQRAFDERYGVPLGNMYGMTELGVIATDLFGEHRPALTPAPGVTVSEAGGQLLIKLPETPYVGLTDPTRFVDGWLHTRDAGVVDPGTGLVTIKGRLDSQVSIGGLKVDLTEVEQTIASLPGVATAVVVFDQGIEAYLTLSDPDLDVESAIATRLAAYKRPRELHVIDQPPRTATGKLVRDRAVLRGSINREGTPT